MANFKSYYFFILIAFSFFPHLLYGQEIDVNSTSDEFSKFKIEAAKKGATANYISDSNDLANPSLIIFYGSESQSISNAYSLANNGQKFVMLFDTYPDIGLNFITEPMINLFMVGVAKEQVMSAKTNNSIKGDEIADLFTGLILGRANVSGIYAYLEPIGDNSKCLGSGLLSEATNERRCLAVEVSIGNGKGIFMIVPRSFKNRIPVADETIEQLDNLEATKRIIDWLIE